MKFEIGTNSGSVEIINRTGGSISDRVTFKAMAESKLSSKDIEHLQTQLGYSPYGYGCFGIREKQVNIKNGIEEWHYEWTCAGNCD